jgi:hypothetical protein
VCGGNVRVWNKSSRGAAYRRRHILRPCAAEVSVSSRAETTLASRCRANVPNPGGPMIVLGVILLILGLVLNVGILWTIGIILVIIGIILYILGMLDRAVLGRRYWY